MAFQHRIENPIDMKNCFSVFLLFFLPLVSYTQPALNVDLFANVKLADDRYSGSWSYISSTGEEYALLGAKSGTSIFNIDDPDNVVELDFVPGPVTNWREITVVKDHAYVVTDVMDVGHGLQVIDLSTLPDSVHLVTTYTETFTKGHIIQKDIDSQDPYVYVMGTNTTQGVHIIDVSNPASPQEVGLYAPGYYIHDCHVRGNLLFAAAFHMAQMDIVDISDKNNPSLITILNYGGSNTHSSSLTEDGKYLFIADELNGNPARIWNVEDLENPYEVAQYSANLETLVHNPYIRGDFCFVAHNLEGFRVLDMADPELPVEVGYYDTFDGPSLFPLGLWSACPYFPSGKIIGGDREKGLFIWEFNETRAGRLYGITRDTFTHEVILNPTITLQSNNETLPVDLFGNFKFGALEGDYTFLVSAPGYHSKIVELNLLEGENLNIEIDLYPENIEAQFGGIVLDSLTLEPVENAELEITELGSSIFSNSDGNFENIITTGNYSINISATDYLPKTLNFNILPEDSLWFEILLAPESIIDVEDFSNSFQLEVFPNPFSEFTTIIIPKAAEDHQINLLDLEGKIIKIFPLKELQEFVIYRESFPAGEYFLELRNSTKSLSVQKLIIQ